MAARLPYRLRRPCRRGAVAHCYPATDERTAPDRPGSDWLPWFPAPPRSTLAGLKASSRLVLLTGDRDFNRLQTETVAERYREEGFEHVTYLEIPGAGHYNWPSARWLSKALSALDP